MLLIEDGRDKAFIDWDAYVAPYDGVRELDFAVPSERAPGKQRAATVEIYRQLGGGPQRAILGAIKQPRASDLLTLAVPTSGPFRDLQTVPCRSLSGKPFLAGLCTEYVQPVLAGLLHWPTTGGELRVTSAAYHEEGTSWFAQLLVAQILSVTLHRENDDLTESEVDTIRRLLRTSARA